MNPKYMSIVMVLALGLIGCSESTIIGNNLVGEEDFQVSYIDTLSVALATFQYDSIVTGNQSRLVVGARSHAMIGDVAASALFNVTTLETPTIGQKHRFDSLVLYLPLDGYRRLEGEVATIAVHADQLSVPIEWGDDGQLYNVSAAPQDVVASAAVTLRLERDRELAVTLPFNALGSTLFEHYQEEGILTADDFADLVGAFRVYADAGSEAIWGIATEEVALKLYYSDMEELPVAQHVVDFPISVNYSQVLNTNVPEAMDLADSEALVSSTRTANQSVLAGGTGYGVRATFPGLKALLLEGDDYLVAAANLQLKPFFDELMESSEYPAYLEVDLYEVGSENILTTEALQAVLHLDADFGRDTYYQLDVTDLVEYMLEPFSTSEFGLRIQLPQEYLRTSADVMMLADSHNGSQLILYTLAID
ncbi:DUF4270 family protein [Marinoscillum furvescens]|uniref:Uncharacterized protein DUF4270 n=1 Tax=Marinoscillum furvescens DSM 4134 TaxID=1122208 RepID=A0A3D9KW89_MARFU|nr:DUF4270 family protein [Marinoscillum furvescens]RED92204.1 uncharacterized protein DUF4270 [Marinoscillum furvescens DSM 4134]